MAERMKNDDQETLKNSAEKKKLLRRKENIQKLLYSKRQLFANKIGEQVGQPNQPQEVEEEKSETKNKEAPRVKGWMNLSKHTRRRKKNKKKCWICRSSGHFKKTCPYIRCFYCKRLGHVKANCHQKMIEFMYNKAKEDLARKEMKMKQNKEKRENRQEEKEYQLKVLKLRAKDAGCKLERKDEKGDIQVLTYKGKKVGEYIGPGLLGPTLAKIRQNTFNFEQLNVLVEKAAPIKCFNLIKGLSNWCACGKIDMEDNQFRGHVIDHHRGIVMRNSQLNRPPWVDWVEFKNDELYEQFCFTDNNLEDIIINNY